MMVMTAKVDLKKILIILAIAAAAIIGLVLIFSPGGDTSPTAGNLIAGNEARVKFLKDFGWDVTVSPTESSQVRIPEKSSEIYDRYNALQKTQGYDLTPYAGKTVMRYVYQINNFPGATEPVYATLLIYKNQVIGGDVTNTAAKGIIQGFARNGAEQDTSPAPSTAPSATVPDNHTTKTNP